MEILDKLLKSKKRNISTVAEAIVTLELTRDVKMAQLLDVQKNLDAHFQEIAVGAGNQKNGESLQQKVFFLDGEVKGITEVIKKALQEAEVFATQEINQAEKEKISLSNRRSKELESVQKEILEACMKLLLLIYKVDGRESINFHSSGYKIKVPILPGDMVGTACSKLKQQMELDKNGPHFTLEAIRKLDTWIESATPKSVLDDVLCGKRQALGVQT